MVSGWEIGDTKMAASMMGSPLGQGQDKDEVERSVPSIDIAPLSIAKQHSRADDTANGWRD